MVETALTLFVLLYLILIGALVYGFDNVEEFKLNDLKPKTKFSIVIPFRNEAKNLLQLLESVLALNYPKSHFELLLIDDNSNDDSVDIIKSFHSKEILNISLFSNLRVSNSPKKDAITLAIEKSSFDWILTTDADCIVPPYWLDAIDEKIQVSKSIAIVGPVALITKNSFINRFQSLEILALQGATMGSFGIKKPAMCNGANFCYRKSAFVEVNGFEGNNDIASGDDLFLLEKFQKAYNKKVLYLKSEKSIVLTQAEENLHSLVEQRLRWASKASNYSSWFSKFLGLTVLLGNLSFILVLALTLFREINIRIAVALIVIKVGIDFLLLFKSARFFNQENQLPSFVLSSILYPFFSVYVTIISFFKPYEWKGRTFKK